MRRDYIRTGDLDHAGKLVRIASLTFPGVVVVTQVLAQNVQGVRRRARVYATQRYCHVAVVNGRDDLPARMLNLYDAGLTGLGRS